MTKLLLPVVMLTCLAMWSFADASENNAQQLKFKVFLDDDEIGFHNHTVSSIEGGEAVSIEASFDIEIFFLGHLIFRLLSKTFIPSSYFGL